MWIGPFVQMRPQPLQAFPATHCFEQLLQASSLTGLFQGHHLGEVKMPLYSLTEASPVFNLPGKGTF